MPQLGWLRQAGAARAASNGATVPQLNAIFGWSDSQVAALYTKSADRVRLAREAIGKLSRNVEWCGQEDCNNVNEINLLC